MHNEKIEREIATEIYREKRNERECRRVFDRTRKRGSERGKTEKRREGDEKRTGEEGRREEAGGRVWGNIRPPWLQGNMVNHGYMTDL